MSEIIDALGLLTPFDIDIPKIRIGPPEDGGYVLADRMNPRQSVLSYGVSTEYRFDAELAARGHRVFMFDHTIDGIDAPHANMSWFKEGVAATTNAHADLYSIADHLRRHDIRGGDLLMQMDVEGAEIDVLATVPDEVLGRFEQIVVEVHELKRLNEPAFRRRVVRMLARLNRQFTLFHIHDNNHDGGSTPYIVAGLPCVSVVELSYIRTNSVQRRPSETLYPTIYDRPNNPFARDKKLWFFPFLPSRVPLERYGKSAARLADQLPRPRCDPAAIDDAFDTRDCIDLAAGKPASMSSTSIFSTPHGARGAVTGEISGTYSFHTDFEEQPWWQVDLGAEYSIQGVVIYNRNDESAARAYHFVLRLAGEAGAFRPAYERKGRPFGNEGCPARIPLGGQRARWVRVQLEGREYLHLDAVKVYVPTTALDAADGSSSSGNP